MEMKIPTLPPTAALPDFVTFGDCKKGETAAKTGCTPQEGGGGKQEGGGEIREGSIQSGGSGVAKVYRGEAKSGTGGGMSAVGDGRYFGLEEGVADIFSKPGTVEEQSIEFENAEVISGDGDLTRIKKDIEETFDVDMGRDGNAYVGFTMGDQAPLFSLWLISQGRDSIIVDYPGGPGGRQLVSLNSAQETIAKIRDPDIKKKAGDLLSGALEHQKAPDPAERRQIDRVPGGVLNTIRNALKTNNKAILEKFKKRASKMGIDGDQVIEDLEEGR